ncbi:class I SAM-dependent methyltransferase [Nesterenkonia alba]|uniref:class I SAM-dependent methyltransferase n=1 Tax=Nesterenkonia alba TaxID=515814 RepID=UPI000428A131|nr:methyltransferase domain-containing protein [Nesterenkonia alba]
MSETPNRPKQRTDAESIITDAQRRRRLGASFAVDQSVIEAREYDAVRPRYPEATVEQILGLTQTRPPTVVELGAGSGILTRELLARGAEVHAVEPSEPMSTVLAETAAGLKGTLHLHRTSAEQTGLPDGVADVVVAGQAWHWFDPETVQPEVARIAAEGASLAIAGNFLNTEHEWVHRLARILRAGDVYRPGWQPPLDQRYFGPVETNEQRWSRPVTPEEIIRLAATLSSWLAADDAERATRRDNLTWYLYEHLGHAPGEQIELPYITVLHTAPLR